MQHLEPAEESRPPRFPANWGALPDEMREPRACDALVSQVDEVLYRAVSVAASPERVFRWLCQLRVAPYSYDWIDNFGRQSPRELTPGLERLELGQPFMRIFELAAFEPGREITLRMRDPKARALFGDVAVTYAVAPDADGPGCRLFAKLVVRYPRSPRGWLMRPVLPTGDWVMMRKQLLTLKRLAERG